MAHNPGITALVTVHSRTQFVAEALQSALSQRDVPWKYEVVLVSGLAEPDLERAIGGLSSAEKQRIRIVDARGLPLGRAYLTGLQSSTGEVVAILNDDDLWEPGRIRYLTEVFASHSGLSYFHNNQFFIDESGRATHRPRGRTVRGRTRDVYIPREGGDRAINLLGRAHADFNSSSIAFDRRILTGRFHLLANLTALDDTFYKYCALLYGGSFFLSSARLTKYRIHRENRSTGERGGDDGGVPHAYSETSRQIDTLKLLEPLVEATGRKNLRRLWMRDLAYLSVLNMIQSGRGTASRRLTSAAALFSCIPVSDPVLNLKATAVALVYFLRPRAGREVYRYFRD